MEHGTSTTRRSERNSRAKLRRAVAVGTSVEPKFTKTTALEGAEAQDMVGRRVCSPTKGSSVEGRP